MSAIRKQQDTSMKTTISTLHRYLLLVFLALFFSSNTVQPLYTNSFNPNNYLQKHYIEYIIPETSEFFLGSDFNLNFREETDSAHHKQSNTLSPFAGVTASDWLPLSAPFDTAYLPLNSIPQVCTPVSVHIRFIKHQSFSDCVSDHSFLI